MSCAHADEDLPAWLAVGFVLLGVAIAAGIEASPSESASQPAAGGAPITSSVGLSAPPFTVRLEVDLGLDRGQSHGSLFELGRRENRALAGAGFLGVYNTRHRGHRGTVHFFVKAPGAASRASTLPRLRSRDTATYITSDGEQLIAAPLPWGLENKPLVWSEAAQAWRASEELTGFGSDLAGERLQLAGARVLHGGAPVLELGAGDFADLYYARDRLFLRQTTQEGTSLLAVPWTPGAGRAELSQAERLDLKRPAVCYAWGQLGDEVLVATSTGGVHAYSSGWRQVRAPDATSFQIYAMLNFEDQLLLGHYPSGEVWSYDGVKLSKFGGPPAPDDVSSRLREAQSMAIYGGDLYVGVWPWGEVWRFDTTDRTWNLVGRAFSHPLSSRVEHPYQQEVERLGALGRTPRWWDSRDRWGQRVTTMVPLGDSLYFATGSKGGAPWDPREQPFLSAELAAGYGRVHRLHRAGGLAVALKRTTGLTTLTFHFDGATLAVEQDGERLGEAPFSAESLAVPPADLKPTWGRGIFGEFSGKLIHAEAKTRF